MVKGYHCYKSSGLVWQNDESSHKESMSLFLCDGKEECRSGSVDVVLRKLN